MEGTVLSKGTDIDIRLGDPIEVREYMNNSEFSKLLTCSDDDIEKLELNPRSAFNEAARRLMLDYMAEIYNLTTINLDHIFATLIRHQKGNQFTERAYRNRIFLSGRQILTSCNQPTHGLLKRTYRNILFEDPNPKFEDFMKVCLKENILIPKIPYYAKNQLLKRGRSNFHSVRMKELTYVIANEIEPLKDINAIISGYARATRKEVSKEIHQIFGLKTRKSLEKITKSFSIKNFPKMQRLAVHFSYSQQNLRLVWYSFTGILLLHWRFGLWLNIFTIRVMPFTAFA